jgi:hypothetical protein
MKTQLLLIIALTLGISACSKDDHDKKVANKTPAEQGQSQTDNENIVTGLDGVLMLTQKYKSIKLTCVAWVVASQYKSVANDPLLGDSESSPGQKFLNNAGYSTVNSRSGSMKEAKEFSPMPSEDGVVASAFETFELLTQNFGYTVLLDTKEISIRSGIYDAQWTLQVKLSDLQAVRRSFDWVPERADARNGFSIVERTDTPQIVVSYNRTIKKSMVALSSPHIETSTGTFTVDETYSGDVVFDQSVTNAAGFKAGQDTQEERLRLKCNIQTRPVDKPSP